MTHVRQLGFFCYVIVQIIEKSFYFNFQEFVFVMVLGYLISMLILYSAFELMKGIVKVTEIEI